MNVRPRQLQEDDEQDDPPPPPPRPRGKDRHKFVNRSKNPHRRIKP